MTTRIDSALATALTRAEEGAPLRLANAIRYAVFPGGARIRPRLCLAVADACGNDSPGLAEAAACALEMVHCASLVHDDLPCFDDAELRRGRPSVHRAFGEALAVLVGDALIVLAFETLAAPEEAGKPTRQDVALSKPNAVAVLGVDGAVSRLRGLVAEAAASVPECPRAGALRELVQEMAERLVPASLKKNAA
jgi:geranylgeranyl diphosphate synthase type II